MARFSKIRKLRGKAAVDRSLDDAIAGLSMTDRSWTAPSRLLMLSPPILDRICAHLSSRAALRLSATCKEAYPRRWFAYVALQFHFRPALHGLSTLAKVFASIRMLSDLLNDRPEYGAVIRSITISDSLMPRGEPERLGMFTLDMLVDRIDSCVAQILSRAPNMHTFAWLFNESWDCLPADRTIQQLAYMPCLRNLSLYSMCASPGVQLPLVSAATEQFLICYDGPSPRWSLAFLQGNTCLRVLNLEGRSSSPDPEWQAALTYAATGWKNLQTLVIDGLILKEFVNAMERCAVLNSWPLLTSVSLTWPYNSHELLHALLLLRRFPIRRMRLVFGRDPSPEALATALHQFPLLEELVFDQHPQFPYGKPFNLEGVGFGKALRQCPKLRILTVSLTHLLYADVDGDVPRIQVVAPAVEEEGEEEDSDAEEEEEKEDAMDIDPSPGEEAPVSPSSSTNHNTPVQVPQEHATSKTSTRKESNDSRLLIMAEEFLDLYLRKPDFQELRFLRESRPKPPRNCQIVRYGQIVEVSGRGAVAKTTGGQEEYQLKYLGILEGKAEDDAFFWLHHCAHKTSTGH